MGKSKLEICQYLLNNWNYGFPSDRQTFQYFCANYLSYVQHSISQKEFVVMIQFLSLSLRFPIFVQIELQYSISVIESTLGMLRPKIFYIERMKENNKTIRKVSSTGIWVTYPIDVFHLVTLKWSIKFQTINKKCFRRLSKRSSIITRSAKEYYEKSEEKNDDDKEVEFEWQISCYVNKIHFYFSICRQTR